MTARQAALAVAILVFLRLLMAALLPLSADEAYYWLWSRHLAAGYYDHPPAIAFLVRAGTAPFGDTPFGVRVFCVLLSLPASWFVFDSARLVLGDVRRAGLAAVIFNVTLMTGIELLAATPDAPSIATAAAYLWCLCRLQAGGDKRWWLAAGAAAGLSLLSKYAMLFLGAGTLTWLVADPAARRWLLTPWPYLGGILAALVFAPNLLWQAQHHWATFAFQFGRIGGGHLTLRYLGEFLGAQFALATPLVFVLMVCGLLHARTRTPAFLPAMLVWTALAYFLFHALYDRVQGNWTCFLYPALAILAASAYRNRARLWRVVSQGAVPLAALFLLLVYALALGALSFAADPIARLLGRGVPAIAQRLVAAHVPAIVTTDYETTAWLRWYAPSLAVIQINESQRYPDAAIPSAAMLNGSLLYLVRAKRDARDIVRQAFKVVEPAGTLPAAGSAYEMFRVRGPRQSGMGRMP